MNRSTIRRTVAYPRGRPRAKTLPFPASEPRPTDCFDLNVPPSRDDTRIRIEYYRPQEADEARPKPGQHVFRTPDGSVFVFAVSSVPASAGAALGARLPS